MTGPIPELSRMLTQAFPGPGSASPGFAFLDEETKRRLRCALLTAVAVPGYQVPFGSSEMPVPRGWGTGGLQVSLASLVATDIIKVIDQGDDESVNATSLRRFIADVTDIKTTTDTRQATVIQSRHRIPETRLRPDQLLILQVPEPEPLRAVTGDPEERTRMHAESDYTDAWVSLYEDQIRDGQVSRAVGHPCVVAGRYVIAPSPIPRWDIPKLDRSDHLTLFGAGREGRVYAIPPHTTVEPLTFEDRSFDSSQPPGRVCRRCGSTESLQVGGPVIAGEQSWQCSDIDWCSTRRTGGHR